MIMRQLQVTLPEKLLWDVDSYRRDAAAVLSRSEVVEAAIWQFLATHPRSEPPVVRRLATTPAFCPKCDEPLGREKGLEWCRRCGFEPDESAARVAPKPTEWTADKEARCDQCHDWFVPGTLGAHVAWAHGGRA